MTFPADAQLYARLAGGVSLYDVSHLLPKHKRKRYKVRDVEKIDRAFVHHSGAMGKLGFEGLEASARYSIREIKRENEDGEMVVRKKAWPGFAYHLWIQNGDPWTVDRDPGGNLVVYMGNRFETRSYHTGGDANTFGVGVVLQGNTTTGGLSWAHEESLEAVLPWLRDEHGLSYPSGLGWHSIADTMDGKRKPTCPGKGAEMWLRGYLRGYKTDAA